MKILFFPFFSVTIRRTRSKSGSPPSRVGSSMGFRSGIHAGQPVSLPPIFNVSNPEIMTSGPTSLTSGYSSMSSRLGTANSSSSNLTPRSSSNLRLDGKVKWISNYFSSKNNIFFFQMTPSLPKSPSDRSISISGTKLKKLSHEDLGRSSRLSTKTPAHWGMFHLKFHAKIRILLFFRYPYIYSIAAKTKIS